MSLKNIISPKNNFKNTELISFFAISTIFRIFALHNALGMKLPIVQKTAGISGILT